MASGIGFVDHPVPDLNLLWTACFDAPEHLRTLAGNRAINAAERLDLRHFIKQGWPVLRNAIEPGLIDQFVNDIRAHQKYPSEFLTTKHRQGQ
ncbi:MAG: hypothetical protein EXR05_03140 [Acetobacteraceae bacterium]|nr:hypothetical protein [Acetobacteraceae bacterium]